MPKHRPAIPFDASVPIDRGYTALGASWRRSMLAQNRSQRTVETYLEAHRRFGLFLAQRELPQDVRKIKREHVEAFITWLLEQYSPATANNRYRGLQQFFKWLLDDQEITSSPMEHMKPPSIPDTPPPVLPEEQIRTILQACTGTDFRARRDFAIILLLIDTGMRRHELATMTVASVNLDEGEARVMGKGARERVVSLGKKATAALDRYLRARAHHPHSDQDALWLGLAGPMTDSGIYQVVRDRAKEVGLEGVYTHLFRHSFASHWLAGGGQEGDAMELAGWKSRSMLDRYGRAARNKRARDAHKKLSPGDRI